MLVDTREQLPFRFEGYDVTVERRTLPVGDYSLEGYEGSEGPPSVAIERKTLDDLVSCLMGANRDRFERELARLSGYEMSAVVVEASMDDVRYHRYRSRMRPKAALMSVIAFQVKYGIAFVWAGSRAGGEFYTFALLEMFHRYRCCDAPELFG